MAEKSDSSRHSTRGLTTRGSYNHELGRPVVIVLYEFVAKISYQMLGILSFSDRERAKPPSV